MKIKITYSMVICDFCGKEYEYESENNNDY
jgi:redox-regulated HSP33 family molecular chaperone